MAWDTLIYRDPKSGQYKGQLATSWKWIDDKTLEMELRQGVKFHNGEEFDAEVKPEQMVGQTAGLVAPRGDSDEALATRAELASEAAALRKEIADLRESLAGAGANRGKGG